MEINERAFFQAVEARILGHRGRGYALSGIEAHKVLAWWQAGYPLAMVLAAIEAAAKRAKASHHREGPGLALIERSLMSLAERRSREGTGAVESEQVAHEHRGWARLRQVIEDVGRRLEDGPVKVLWRGLWTRLVAAEAAGEDAWEFARAADDATLVALRGLVPAEVLESAARDAEARDGFVDASPRAQDEMVALAQAQASRTFAGLPELLEALLYP